MPDRPSTPETADPIDVSTSGSIGWDALYPGEGGRYYSFTPATDLFVTFHQPTPVGVDDGDLYWEVYQGVDWDEYEYIGAGYEGTPEGVQLESGLPYFLYLSTQYLPADTFTGTLSWTTDPPVDPPAYVVTNDDFTTPIAISVAASSGGGSYDNTGATEETEAPPGWQDEKRSIWFELTDVPERSIVGFEFTPSTTGAAYQPDTPIFYGWNGSAWTYLGDGDAFVDVGQDVRVRVAFPTGNQGLWDDAGTYAWTRTPAAPNGSGPTAEDVSSAAGFSVPAYSSTQYVWIRVTVSTPGGFMVVLGDGSTPLPPGVSISALVFSEAVALVEPTDFDAALGSVSWSSTEVAGTAKFVYAGAEIGDVFYLRVGLNNWPGGVVPLRKGVSTTLTFGDWHPTDAILEGGGGDPRRFPFYATLPGITVASQIPGDDLGDPDVQSITAASWIAVSHVEEPGHSAPSAHDWTGIRGQIDAGTNYDNHLSGSASASDAYPVFHSSGVGVSTPMYRGYNLGGTISWGLPGSINEGELHYAGLSHRVAFAGPSEPDFVGIETFEDWRWWVDHWALWTNRALFGLPGTFSAFRTALQGMAVEWSDDGGTQMWEVTNTRYYSWERHVSNPFLGDIPFCPPEPYTLEVREGPVPFREEDDLQRWHPPAELDAMPLLASVEVPPAPPTDPDPEFEGSGIIPGEFYGDVDAVAPVPFDWEAAWTATTEAPYIPFERVHYRTLSLYSQSEGIDVQGLIDGHAAKNPGVPAGPFWQYTGVIAYSSSMAARYPDEARLGTYVETWEMGRSRPLRQWPLDEGNGGTPRRYGGRSTSRLTSRNARGYQ
jgi:hypothetical protein